MENTKDVNLKVEINKTVIFEIHEQINDEKVISTVNTIEKLLLDNNVKQGKIKSINEVTIEVLQNIINYSYKCDEKKCYSNFKISYNTLEDEYTINSSNIIKEENKNKIEASVNEILNLDKDALRKLIRTKMRTKEGLHKKGSGLGFIVMAKKSSKDMKIAFEDFDKNLLKFKLELYI